MIFIYEIFSFLNFIEIIMIFIYEIFSFLNFIEIIMIFIYEKYFINENKTEKIFYLGYRV